MSIDNATLIQADITAIIGVIIFLTLQGVKPAADSTTKYKQRRAWFGLTAVLVIPFALSALTILIEDSWYRGNEDAQESSHLAKIFAAVGFF